jgi:hypothetical protein
MRGRERRETHGTVPDDTSFSASILKRSGREGEGGKTHDGKKRREKEKYRGRGRGKTAREKG